MMTNLEDWPTVHSNIIDSAVRFSAKNGKMQVDVWFDLSQQWRISHSVAAPAYEFVVVYNDEGNTLMAELVEQYPEKLSGLAVANPWYGERAMQKTLEIVIDTVDYDHNPASFVASRQLLGKIIENLKQYLAPC